MILSQIFLIPLLIIVIVVFFRLSPPRDRAKGVMAYNVGSVAIALILVLVYVLRTKADMGQGPDRGWWPVVGMTVSPLIIIGVLVVSGILRNYVLYKK